MIKIGNFKVTWKFIFLVALVLFLIYMKWKSGNETINPGNVLDIFGLK